jgi:hypothetical protein
MSNLAYVRQDFLRVTPNMGIAVQAINMTRPVNGLTRALCLKFQGLEQLITGQLELGSVIVYDKPDLLLAAVVVQQDPGPANGSDTYNSRRSALFAGLMYICEANPGRPLYVPYMLSCGQAGDDWKVIEAMLIGLPNPVFVCVPNWAEDAAEMLGYLTMTKPPELSKLVTDDTYAPMRSYKISA